VSTERAVFTAARQLLRKLRTNRRLPVRLLGVQLTQLDDGDLAEQLSLLPEATPVVTETPRDRALAAAMDKVRARFGAGAVQPASLMLDAAPASVEDRTETDGRRPVPTRRHGG
jgi:hypothetical protein